MRLAGTAKQYSIRARPQLIEDDEQDRLRHPAFEVPVSGRGHEQGGEDKEKDGHGAAHGSPVIPAKAGISKRPAQRARSASPQGIPAFAGMTGFRRDDARMAESRVLSRAAGGG